MTTVVAPFKVVSTLYGRAGLQCSAAADSLGTPVWLFTHSDASPQAAARMLEGAEACRADGPWLKVLDCGKDGARAWAVTLPHPGKTLAEVLMARGALDAPEMMRAVTPVCHALQRLSDEGHRAALAPELVLTGPEGEGLLIGFSPEQPQAPVPAVGALMFEALKGSPPSEPPEDLIGVRRQLSDFIRACLEGRLSQPALVAEQLRMVGRGETVDLGKLVAHDTRVTPGAAAPEALGQRAGEVLGSYQLVRRLGEGGMGEVYLGRHVKLGREVAVKVLRAEFAKDPEISRRFFQEARVVNEINHPHIVEVIDFVEELDHAYCVMELLKGDALDRVMQHGGLEVARVCSVMAQACEALHAAHQRGIVHRDVKPANIFVTELHGKRDFVKVLDFGVARVAKLEGSRTQAGTVLGTPAYMSPEQAQGRVVDARADVYSVGAVLYELLSGRVLSEEAFTPPPLIDTARGEPVPGRLAELVQQCLEMDPSKRPQSALEVAQRLTDAVPARPPLDTRRALAEAGLARSGSRGSKAPVFAALALLLAVGGGSAVFFSRPSASEPPVVIPPPPEPAPSPSPLAGGGRGEGAKEAPKEAPQPTPPTRPQPKPQHVKPTKKQAAATAPTPEATADAYVPRMNRLQKEYDGLVTRYGVQQLTSLEREVVRQALEDFAGHNYGSLEGTLKDAEKALQAAHQRLDR
ncbi:MAG: protein kinase [Archangiaceae bacterium]|nr:protein kinase [Archangiaceae bacterium]